MTHARHRQVCRGAGEGCVSTRVEQGEITHDLAILIRADHPWPTTKQFLDALDANPQRAMR
jgi:isocitrate dehydrogenase